MTTAIRRPEPVTIEAFDRFVEAQADTALFELVEGVIVMMTNPTEVHEQIAANIGAPLKLAMDARGCRTYQGDMRVQRSDDPRDTDKTRPDVVVRCGALGTKNFITDPLVVIEVLSPTTIDMDRGPKLDFYKSLPTVRHIALIYQDQMRVEHYRRGEQGFELEVLKRPEEALHFEAVEFRIDLARIYFGVTL
jgi:Uma2 family endonuclease